MNPGSISDFQEQLRGAGLRATLPRIAVLRLLTAAQAARTHAEVAEVLAGDGFDRATVYRNLMDLSEAGLVRRTDVGDHVWRFELVRDGTEHNDAEHPHFICGSCGAVACLPEGSVSVHPQRGAPRALRRKGLTVQVRGLCDACC